MSAADSLGYWAEGSRLVLRHAGGFFTPRRRVVLATSVVLTAALCAVLYAGALELLGADWIDLFNPEVGAFVLPVVLFSGLIAASICLFVWSRLEKNGRAPAMTRASRKTASRAIHEMLKADREGRTVFIDPGDLTIVAELVTYLRRALPTSILVNLLAAALVIPILLPAAPGQPIALLGLFFLVLTGALALVSLRALGQTSALLRAMLPGDEYLA